MHGDGIMGALWQTARRLVTGRHGIRVAVAFALAVGMTTGASAVPVTYNYTGSNFAPPDCPVGDCSANAPTTSQSITGNFIVDGGLGSSSSTISPNIISYSFTDGVNTISSAMPGATILGAPFFQTDAVGSIQNFFIAFTLLQSDPSGGSSRLSMSISSLAGDTSSYSGLSINGTTISAFQGSATTLTPGTWSSPCKSDLQGAVTHHIGGKFSLSGKLTSEIATFTPATGVSLEQAKTDCGYTGFNWEQVITNYPSPSPFYYLSDPCVKANPSSFVIDCTSFSTNPSLPPVPDPNPQELVAAAGPNGLVFPFHPGSSPLYYTPPELANFAVTDTSLLFRDTPADPCLDNSPFPNDTVNAMIQCSSLTTGYMEFTTQLVGINQYGPVLLPSSFNDSFSWKSNYNGTSGGLPWLSNPEFLADLGTGSGGVIDSSTSAADTSVAEPAVTSIFVLGLIILMAHQLWQVSKKSSWRL